MHVWRARIAYVEPVLSHVHVVVWSCLQCRAGVSRAQSRVYACAVYVWAAAGERVHVLSTNLE